jgi:hypothetical protein
MTRHIQNVTSSFLGLDLVAFLFLPVSAAILFRWPECSRFHLGESRTDLGTLSYPIIPNPEIESYKHQLHYIKYVTKDKQVCCGTIHAEKVEGSGTKSNLLLPHVRRCLLPPIVSIILQK